MTDEAWQCEGCGDMQTGEPAAEKNYQGYRETVTLWFCEECTRIEQ